MNITNIKKWLNEHNEEIMISWSLINHHPFLHIDPKITMRYRTDEMEKFIDELTIDELRKIVKGRDWYYLVEWQDARRKVKEELFL